MKKRLWMAAVAAGMATAALAIDGFPIKIFNDVNVGYDDNIYSVGSNVRGSFTLNESLDLSFNVSRPATRLALHYRPTLQWYPNRVDKKVTVNQAADIVLDHDFTPAFKLGLKDTFAVQQDPAYLDRGAVVRDNGTYVNNDLTGKADYKLRPNLMASVNGQYYLLNYQDDYASQFNDYSLYAGGAALGYQVVPETTVSGNFDYQKVSYTDSPVPRDSDNYFVYAGGEHKFNQALSATLNLGAQFKSYESSLIGSDTSPYVELTGAYMPSPATRFTGGVMYSLYETDLYPYANQNRTRLFLSAGRDVTARIKLSLTGSYTYSKYFADQSALPGGSDGSEDLWQLLAAADYTINRIHSVYLSYELTSLGSDLRDEYNRNRVLLGWRLRI